MARTMQTAGAQRAAKAADDLARKDKKKAKKYGDMEKKKDYYKRKLADSQVSGRHCEAPTTAQQYHLVRAGLLIASDRLIRCCRPRSSLWRIS